MGFDSRKAAELVASGHLHVLAEHEAFANFAAIPSNLHAFENGLLFAIGRSRYGILAGPSGWGKTTLIEGVGHLMASLGRPSPISLTSAEFVRRRRSIDPHRPLIIEDVQESLRRQKDRTLLQQFLERRIRSEQQTYLIMTANPSVSELRRALPYFGRWTISRIASPATSERRVVAELMASSTGLKLADPLLGLLSGKLTGNGRSINGALKCLRLEGESWQTDEEVLRACGVLYPFFLDNGSFDLGHTIFDCARNLVDQPAELAAYTMRRISGLPEDAVARHLEVSPSEVFRMANRITRKLGQSDELRRQAEKLAHMVVKEIS